jgi:eukaryotic-like serine/threonine-protein kinase
MSDSLELLRRWEEGDSRAAGLVFDRYVERLLALARSRIGAKLGRRIDAEDVVQSAYRSFFVHAASAEYVLEHSGDLWRLLAGITLNKLYGQAEKHTAARRSIDREDAADSFVGQTADRREPAPVEAIALAEQLHLVIERMAPMERSVLTARLQGQTNDQIAAALGNSPRTVRRILTDVERRLEQELIASAELSRRAEPLHAGTFADARAPLSYADYVLEQLVGAGGMGKVYRAVERRTGATVAIKSLHKARQRDPRAVEGFLREGEILAMLDHPNIVGVRGLGRFPAGGFFLALDFVDGRDLQSTLDGGRLGVAEVVRTMILVAGAIGYAHERGIVHGDLKPSNVLMDREGRVFVSDFGLAHFVRADCGVKERRAAVGGTLGYMAPEVRASGKPPTVAADIYAIGAMTWALVTGDVPAHALAAAVDSTLEPLAAICRQCMDESPAARFRRASEVIVAMQRLNAKVDGSRQPIDRSTHP